MSGATTQVCSVCSAGLNCSCLGLIPPDWLAGLWMSPHNFLSSVSWDHLLNQLPRLSLCPEERPEQLLRCCQAATESGRFVQQFVSNKHDSLTLNFSKENSSTETPWGNDFLLLLPEKLLLTGFSGLKQEAPSGTKQAVRYPPRQPPTVA